MCVCISRLVGGIVYLQQEAVMSGCLWPVFASVSLGWIPVNGLMCQRADIILVDIVIGCFRFHKEGFPEEMTFLQLIPK